MIDSLEMNDETATAIVAVSQVFEIFEGDDIPDNEKDRLQSAHETITFSIDAYKQGYRTDGETEEHRDNGEQVETFLKIAGITIDDDGDITYGKPLTGTKLNKVLAKFDLELASEDEDEDEEEVETPAGSNNGDEPAFSIDDYIDGYDELTPASKIKGIKALKLDLDDEDDVAVLGAIADYEDEADKPSSRVLDYIGELIGIEDEDEEQEEEIVAEEEDNEGDEEEPWTEKELGKLEKEELREVADEFGVDFPKRMTPAGKARTIAAIMAAQQEDDEGEAEEEEEAAESDEPFEGYDEMSVKDIKAGLTEAVNEEEDPLDDPDDVQVVIDYEEANKNRLPLVKWLDVLKDELAGEQEAEEEEEAATAGTVTNADGIDPDDNEIEEMLPKGLARTFVMSQMRQAESQLVAHGLQAPEDYKGDFPELPDDIDSTDYSELSNILLALQNAHATTTWQKSYHYIWSGTFEEIAEYMEAIALQNVEGPNEPARKAMARTSERVVFFRARHKEHYNSYVRFRDLGHTIEGKIKAVSRVLGFKDDEEQSGDLSPKKAANNRSTSRRVRAK